MKRNTRLIHKWLGLVSCLFILLVAMTAVALNHQDMFPKILKNTTTKEFSSQNIKVMASDPFHSGHIIASDLKGLFQSSDNGKNWKELKLFVPAENVNNIVFDPFKHDKLVVSLKKAGIFISDDLGEVWDELTLPFFPNEGEYIENLALSKNQINIKTRFGLYLYNSETEKWTVQMFKGINNKAVLDLEQLVYNIHTGRIFGEAGVFVYDLLSAGLIILALSGIYLSFKPRIKIKKTRVTVSKDEIQIKEVSEVTHN